MSILIHIIRFLRINWYKTLFFNFKMFPYKIALKLPVYFYGKVRFNQLNGRVLIKGPVKRGMIGFGQRFEMITVSKGNAEILINGTLIFGGHVQFGKDYFVHISENAQCEMGHMSSLGGSGKLICTNKILFGTYARVGYESQIVDTTFHQMIDLQTGTHLPMSGPIILGDYNYIGNRSSLMARTVTPKYCTVASNSLCNKDYTYYGDNVLIGGIPAKLIKSNISRDWEGEKIFLEKLLIL